MSDEGVGTSGRGLCGEELHLRVLAQNARDGYREFAPYLEVYYRGYSRNSSQTEFVLHTDHSVVLSRLLSLTNKAIYQTF